MTRYAWMLTQVPTILGHLRDSMMPLAATRYDNTRVDGTREQPLPFRLEPMEDADTIWGELLDYGRIIAAHIHPAPHALTGSAARQLRASTQWHDAADAAYTVTAWLTFHEQTIADLDPMTNGTDEILFATISRLLAKYRIAPARLRTYTRECRICGEASVYAEWALDRHGRVAQTEQCTVCLERYEHGQLPTRTEVLAIWAPPAEEINDAAHVLASSQTSAPLRRHDQAMA